MLATLLPESGQPVASHLCLVCGPLGGLDALLNVLLFIPLGVGLALCGVPAGRAILMMSGLSLLVETAQLLFIPGRDASIGDVLTNTLGGALGVVGSRYARFWLRPPPGDATRFVAGWGAIWLTIEAISSFALAPSIPESQYYGQLSPALGNFAVFQGRVLSASVGDVAIPNAALIDSHGIRSRLLRGETIATRVVAGDATADPAPIVRVADSEQREIVLLAQSDTDLLFAIRSGATDLRLRPPHFALPQAFPKREIDRGPKVDTLALGGQYLPREVRMSAETASETRRIRFPLTASLGWTLFLPWQWFIQGTGLESIISSIWLACLILPLGYWAAYSDGGARQRADVARFRALAWPAIAAIIYAGLVLIPRAFGLADPPVRDWLAAFVGLVFGGTLAGLVSEHRPKAGR